MPIIIQQLKTAIALLISMTLITGLVYPECVTAIAQFFFPWQANGSILQFHGKKIGSALIGQAFTQPRYFQGRPSATSPYPYNATNSSGSNLSPTNPDYINLVKYRIQHLAQQYPKNTVSIPMDLITASASGLDPDISISAAFYQAQRIAKQRHLSEEAIMTLIQKHIKERSFYVLGQPRLNVLELNLALDSL